MLNGRTSNEPAELELGLNVISDRLDWNLALKVETHVVSGRVGDYFFPLVFDDRAGLDRRKRKLFVLSFTPLTFTTVFSTTSSFVNSTIEPSGLMVRAATSLILVPLKNGISILLLLLAATFSENLDANVMRQHQIVLAAIINTECPENSFGIGVRIHQRLLQSQFRGLHRTPTSSPPAAALSPPAQWPQEPTPRRL